MDSAKATIPKFISYELLVTILLVPQGMTAYLTGFLDFLEFLEFLDL